MAEVRPTVVGGPDGESLARVLGDAEDAEQTMLTDGTLARLAHRAPYDALDDCGRAMQRPRAPTPEATDSGGARDEAYRARLGAAAWSYWETAPYQGGGMVQLFAPYGDLPVCFSNHDTAIDSNSTFSSRVFWIWDGALTAEPVWDDPYPSGTVPLWDDGGLWDIAYDTATPSGFGVSDLAHIRRDIRRTKAAQAFPVMIFVGLVVYDDGGPFWDSTGGDSTWDVAGALPWDDTIGTDDWTILPIGRMWDEESQFYGGGPGAYDEDDDEVYEDFCPPVEGGTW